MNCPYCQKEMEAGYICTNGGRSRRSEWLPLTKKPFLGMVVLGGGIKLGSKDDPWLRIKAFNCTQCKKIIVDYSSE
jgi:hypothetical protein